MKYTEDFEKMGFPEDFKFGIELEAFNVNTKGKNSLYNGQSAEYIKGKNWHMASSKEESLVSEGGAELVSPILHDTENDWKTISDMCSHMQKFPGKFGDKVIADSKCGLHVHFDADCIFKDPNRVKMFMQLYAESEELIYKMCNDKNDPIRKNAINKNFKGINQMISSIWRNGMASPSGKRIANHIENNTLKVSYKKFGKLRRFLSKFKIDERRYHGLNLTNVGNPNKNTIEFRMANGTLNPNVIKQNVFLYASLLNTSIQATEHPELYIEKLQSFFNKNQNEQQKAENFLNLIMDNPNEKQIFLDRWQSVKDSSVFKNNHKKGFVQNSFKRDEFKKIAYRTPGDIFRSTFNKLKAALQTELQTGEKEGVENDR